MLVVYAYLFSSAVYEPIIIYFSERLLVFSAGFLIFAREIFFLLICIQPCQKILRSENSLKRIFAGHTPSFLFL